MECGFLSNAEDTARLVGEDYQKKLAAAIYSAFIVFCDGDEQIIGE